MGALTTAIRLEHALDLAEIINRNPRGFTGSEALLAKEVLRLSDLVGSLQRVTAALQASQIEELEALKKESRELRSERTPINSVPEELSR